MKTIEELAGDFKVSTRTIRREIKDGKLNAIKIGKQWRFDEDQVNDYLRSRTTAKKR